MYEREVVEFALRSKMRDAGYQYQTPNDTYGSNSGKDSTGGAILGFIVLILVGVYFFGIPVYEFLSRGIDRIKGTNFIYVLIISVTLLLILIGRGLYEFKLRWQTQYGLTEIIFSIFSCLFNVKRFMKDEQNPTLFGVFVTILAAVYFIQRGFQNYYEGKRKSAEQKRLEELSKKNNEGIKKRSGKKDRLNVAQSK